MQAETLLQIPAQLSDPVAIIRPDQNASNPDGLIVLSNLTETEKGKEKPIVITLSFQDSHKGKVRISSLYGRRISQIQQGLNGDILYWNTEKGSELVNTFGLQLPPELCSPQNLSRRDIKTQHDLSQAQKDKNMDNSQTLHMPLDETPNSPFIQAIEQIEQGITPKKPYIRMGNTPEVLQLVGIPDLKIPINQHVIFKLIYNHLSKEAIEKLPYGVKDNLHGILPDDLKKIPQELNNPIAIFKSRTTEKGGFLVLTEIKENKNSNELAVTVAINLKVKDSEIEAVNVSSVYGREWELLAKDFSENLLYIDTKKVIIF